MDELMPARRRPHPDMKIAPKLTVVSVGAALGFSACASIPAGPNVLVLPGNGKSFEQFQTDDAACRQWSAQQTGTSVQVRYDIAYAQCMYAKGNQIPVAR
jgi:hypothetical protein